MDSAACPAQTSHSENPGRLSARAPAGTPAALGSATDDWSSGNHLLSEARMRVCGVVENWIRLEKTKTPEAPKGSQRNGLVGNGSGTGSA